MEGETEQQPSETEKLTDPLVEGIAVDVISVDDEGEERESTGGGGMGRVRGPWSPEEDVILSRLIFISHVCRVYYAKAKSYALKF
ncbi:Hypothetical predicted protein [Olea europaea subsp. europaea]|uniref:Uncharacterized protein n=1 Tax=Olea europaea subsp. europaea TaxID=158383 RepID=A0A8S0VAY2_OLEEU|nr:Hypothetical predicted protein [Olea europaea subsp. europaea]